MDNDSQGMGVTNVETSQKHSGRRRHDDPSEELFRVLSARITAAVKSHKTDDWCRFFDELCALVCRVVARSNLNTSEKYQLTRRLLDRIGELEKSPPRSTSGGERSNTRHENAGAEP
jgi:hypothetical protein